MYLKFMISFVEKPSADFLLHSKQLKRDGCTWIQPGTTFPNQFQIHKVEEAKEQFGGNN